MRHLSLFKISLQHLKSRHLRRLVTRPHTGNVNMRLSNLLLPTRRRNLRTIKLGIFNRILNRIINSLHSTLIIMRRHVRPNALDSRLITLLFKRITRLTLRNRIRLNTIRLPVNRPKLPISKLSSAITRNVNRHMKPTRMTLSLTIFLSMTPNLKHIIIIILSQHTYRTRRQHAFRHQTRMNTRFTLLQTIHFINRRSSIKPLLNSTDQRTIRRIRHNRSRTTMITTRLFLRITFTNHRIRIINTYKVRLTIRLITRLLTIRRRSSHQQLRLQIFPRTTNYMSRHRHLTQTLHIPSRTTTLLQERNRHNNTISSIFSHRVLLMTRRRLLNTPILNSRSSRIPGRIRRITTIRRTM